MFWLGAGAGLVATMVVSGVARLWPRRVPKGRSVSEIRQRVDEELSEMETDVWPIGYPHEAPDHPMGLLEAKLTMQRHRKCSKEDCPRKGAAWQALVEAGKIRPETGRNY